MKIQVLILFVFVPFAIFAQVKYSFINPELTYTDALSQMQNGHFDKAIKQLKEIQPNDSLYRSSLELLVECHFNLENYDTVLALYSKHNNVKDGHFRQISLYNAVSLMRLEKYEKARLFLENLNRYYPEDYLINYNLGIIYDQLGEYALAVKKYQQTILQNVSYAPVHNSLGDLCHKNHNISQALMCWDVYLLLDPNGDNSLNVLSKAHNAVSSSPANVSINISISPDDQSFKEMDLMISNQISLNKKYKTPIKSELAFVKQNYALLEMLENYEGNNGFWSTKYVPLFQEIMANEQVEPFMYTMLQSYQEKKNQKKVKKTAKKRNVFNDWFNQRWIDLVGSANFANADKKYFYLNNGLLTSIGEVNKQNQYHGEVTFYTNGRISTTGSFNHNKRTGKWTWFDEFGTKTEEMVYDIEGNPNGDFIKYHHNGQVKSKATLIGGNYEGEYIAYNEYGVIAEKTFYKNDLTDSVSTIYHPLGENYPSIVVPYNKGKIEGKVMKKNAPGTIVTEINFTNNTREDKELHYFSSGNLSYLYTYNQGKLDGKYESYYNSGKVHKTGWYNNDERDSLWTTFYQNGKKSYIIDYKNGKLHGEYTFYGFSGIHPEYTYTYENDELTTYKHFGKAGDLLGEGRKDSAGIVDFTSYNANGTIKAIGEYQDGKREKTWKFYDGYGTLESIEFYNEDVLQGKDSTFYANKIPRAVTTYNYGMAEGLHQSFYINGTLQSIGKYRDDEVHRFWYAYFPDGTLKSVNYYKDGNKEGNQSDYTVEGRLFTQDFYKDGSNQYTEFYDSSGNIFESIHYFTDSVGSLHYFNGAKRLDYSFINGWQQGKFSWYYPNGKISSTGNYVMGEKQGEWNWYYDSGHLQETGTYILDELVGVWTSYHENGEIHVERRYDDNYLLHGNYKRFNEEGTLINSIAYIDNEKHGPGYYFDKHGNIQMIRYYDYGELIGYSFPDKNGDTLPMVDIEAGTATVTTYYQNGNKAREFDYVDGVFHGVYTEYYENGHIQSKDNYFYDYKNGESLEYFENGNVKIKATYLNDELHGEFVSYYENGNVKLKTNYKNGIINGWFVSFYDDERMKKKIKYYNNQVYEAEYF